MAVDSAWVALSLLPHIGNKTLRALMDTFGTAYAVLAADTRDLMQIHGVGKKIAESITAINLAQVESDIENWQRAGLQILLQTSPDYPGILSQIPDPPLILFMRGHGKMPSWERTVAIVGTRNPSRIAAKLAGELSNGLAEDNWTIISGLALGIDRLGHEGALRSSNGQTIAVLGSGVLNIYPPENYSLAQKILERGFILSENHPHASPKATRLVTRNRIITGLCQHVIVVETGIDGGAMHAAHAALKQGRTLHCFDFPATGNQELLQNGANCLSADLSQLKF